MLSKCANPDCSELFLYLHQGKLFHLSPTPDLEAVTFPNPSLYERFWLCDKCSRKMTLVWDGTRAKVLPLSDYAGQAGRVPLSTAAARESRHGHTQRHPSGQEDWYRYEEEVSMSVDTQKTQQAPANSTFFQHILVATDFSEPSHRALCDALSLATEHNAGLSVVHVLQTDWKYAALENPPELDRERIDAEQKLQQLIHKFGSEKKIDTILVRHGPVAEAIASLIEETGVDLLVIGTHGRGGLRKLALGSVAEELLRTVPCPVMTIGPKADIAGITHGPGFHSILFATDFGPGSAKALPIAVRLARTSQAKLTLVHMIPPMPATNGSLSAFAPSVPAADELEGWEQSFRKRALRQLEECLSAENLPEREPEYVVGIDFLPEGILGAAAKFKVDLIVMGANRAVSARAAAHLPWSAVHEVIRDARCAVLTLAG